MKKLSTILICAVRRLRRRGFGGRQLPVVCLLLSAVVIAVSALNASPIPLSTTTEFTATTPARFRAYHGETVRLTHRLTLAGAPLDLSGASARFYWRTEEMEDWWSTDATLEGNAVSCDFTPEMDPGTEAIWYFFGITQANAIAYRANGSLTLLDSPGFTPADLGEPDALAAALKALFKEADTRYATKEQLSALAREQTANSEQLTAHSEQLTANSQQLTALEAQVAGKADASHTHADLQQSATVLLQAINSEAKTREEADAALEAQIAGKADKTHTHTIAQVSNLQTQLNAKAATSTVSALTSRVSSLETEALRLEDAKADALTREATVNNVGSLDPMSDTSMATADQMNGLSYQKTTLGAMGFAGAAVKITHFTTFRRSGSTENGDSNMWLRILRHNGTAWTVAYQAATYVTHNSYTLNGQRIEHTMEHKVGTQFIPTDEPVIFCYATSESAPASSFINFGMKVVPASPNMLASGQSSLPAVNATPGWAYSLAFDARYEQQVALSEALEDKQDKLAAGENITITADGTISARCGSGTASMNLEGGKVSFGDNHSGASFTLTQSLDEFTISGSKRGTNLVSGTIPTTAVTDGLDTRLEALEASGGLPPQAVYLEDVSPNIFRLRTSYSVSEPNSGGSVSQCDMVTFDNAKRTMTVVSGNSTAVEHYLALSPRTSHAIAWQEGTSLLTVTPNADGAVVFDPTGWPEGQSLLVRLTTPEDFGGVPASVRLVGYFDIEPASTYQLTAYVMGGTLHVVPLLREE